MSQGEGRAPNNEIRKKGVWWKGVEVWVSGGVGSKCKRCMRVSCESVEHTDKEGQN